MGRDGIEGNAGMAIFGKEMLGTGRDREGDFVSPPAGMPGIFGTDKDGIEGISGSFGTDIFGIEIVGIGKEKPAGRLGMTNFGIEILGIGSSGIAITSFELLPLEPIL